jgi:dTDP-4-dehydrorhamnose 3,5-epimerase
MASAVFTPSAARGVRFDDPEFGIQWPLIATAVSEQDRNWPLIMQPDPSKRKAV